MKQNLHTHTNICDGQNFISEIIESAICLDLDVLGFSGHSFTYFDKSYCMSEEGTLEYISTVIGAREMFKKNPELATKLFAPGMEYHKPLRIFLGIEQDLYSDQLALRREKGLLNPGQKDGIYDYIIGSTHAFRLNWDELKDHIGSLKDFQEPDLNGVETSDDGIYLYVDYGLEPMNWAIENIFHGDALEFADWYYRDEGRIVEETGCDIVGHFDLLTKFNEQKMLFDENSPRYIVSRNRALEQIFESFRAKGREPIFEINTGAMAKGYRTSPYPSDDTLKLMRDMGAKLVINSDCHKKECLLFGYEEAKRLALSHGFKEERLDTPYGEIEIYV